MKVLIISDFRDWAFGHISRNIKRFNLDTSIDFNIIYTHENGINIAKNIWQEYDIIFIMGWYMYKNFQFIPKEKIIVGIHSFCSWDMYLSKCEKVLPPPQALINYLQGFLRINIVSKRLFSLFSRHNHLPLYYTPNGVDCDSFYPKKAIPDKFMVGTISKSLRWKLKNIDKIFIPSAHISNVNYRILSGESTYEEMPDFYNSLSCYVCTSRSEGFSMSCLEAGSCGRPVISTNVSGTEEMILPGKTGLIAEMSIDNISKNIKLLKNDVEKCKYMGENMRKHIIENYSWQKVIPSWISFLKGDK